MDRRWSGSINPPKWAQDWINHLIAISGLSPPKQPLRAPPIDGEKPGCAITIRQKTS